MLSFQSPQKLAVIFIAIFIAQFSFTQAVDVKCLGGFNLSGDGAIAICSEKDPRAKPWNCPTATCKKDGKPWIFMSGCLHNGVAGSGVSQQHCSQYNPSSSTYGCKNPGGQVYVCPFEGDAPYLTCSDCFKPKEGSTRLSH